MPFSDPRKNDNQSIVDRTGRGGRSDSDRLWLYVSRAILAAGHVLKSLTELGRRRQLLKSAFGT
jgi:hypothetical protein